MNVLLESGRINTESIFESTHKKAALVNEKFDKLRSKNPTLQDRVGSECSDDTWQQQGEEEEIAIKSNTIFKLSSSHAYIQNEQSYSLNNYMQYHERERGDAMGNG